MWIAIRVRGRWRITNPESGQLKGWYDDRDDAVTAAGSEDAGPYGPPYLAGIRSRVLANKAYRRVLHTGEHQQVVAMNLKPGENTGIQARPQDQMFWFAGGKGMAALNGKPHGVSGGDVVLVPAGTKYDFRAGEAGLSLFTVYAPPAYAPGTVAATRDDGVKSDALPSYLPDGPSIPVTTAHLIHTVGYNLIHAARHLDVALGQDRTPKQRVFDMQHAQAHTSEAAEHLEKLTAHMIKNYPPEGKELQAMDRETFKLVPTGEYPDKPGVSSDPDANPDT